MGKGEITILIKDRGRLNLEDVSNIDLNPIENYINLSSIG